MRNRIENRVLLQLPQFLLTRRQLLAVCVAELPEAELRLAEGLGAHGLLQGLSEGEGGGGEGVQVGQARSTPVAGRGDFLCGGSSGHLEGRLLSLQEEETRRMKG